MLLTMILGIAMIDDKDHLIRDIKGLDKRSQVELLRSLLQQLEPEVVSEASEDVVINVGNNNNKNNNTYADVVLNLYLGQDSDSLASLLDAAAYRLRNKESVHPVE